MPADKSADLLTIAKWGLYMRKELSLAKLYYVVLQLSENIMVEKRKK